MKSPFEVFRKHQKVLMVILIGMAMFAFIFLDTVMGMNQIPRSLLVLMLAGVVAGLGWIVGTQVGKGKGKAAARGKPSEFALWGAILGVAVGIVWMRFSGPAPAVKTSAGNLSFTELDDMRRRQQIAQRFMSEAYVAAVGNRPEEPDPRMRELLNHPQFRDMPFVQQMRRQYDAVLQWEQGLRYATFGMPPGRTPGERDVVLNFLLRKEADKMGIQVSNEAVWSHIDRATRDSLSQNAYVSIRRELSLSEGELLDILRDQIKAQLALEISLPPHQASPQELWTQYRRTQFKQKIEAAPVQVAAFTDSVPDPSESELREFFEQHTSYPWEVPASEPAFGQPRKVKVAWLEADPATVEEDVLEKNPVTDEQIREYYEENKDREYRTPQPMPHPGLLDGGAQNDPFLNGPRIGGGAQEGPVEAPRPNEPPRKKSDGAPNPDGTREKTPAAPAKPQGPKPATDDSSAAADTRADQFLVAALDEQDGADAKSKPLVKQPAEPKPATGSKPTGSKPAGSKSSGTKPAASKPAASQPKSDRPSAAAEPATDAESAPDAEGPVEAIRPYRPLDDLARQEIRDILERQRTREEIARRLEKARTLMLQLHDEYQRAVLDEEEQTFDPQEASRTLEEYARRNLGRDSYRVTSLVSFEEFADREDYPLSASVELQKDLSAVNEWWGPRSRPETGRAVPQVLFSERPLGPGERPLDLYRVRTAIVEDTDTLYLYWKIEDVPPHKPTFDEPGIREQVLTTWKEFHARKHAEARAKELAEIVRKSGTPIQEALADQKLTDEADSPPVVILPVSEEFSWLRTREQTSVASTGLQQGRPITPRLWDLSIVEDPGEEFMRSVWDELKPGEIGVAPNADRSVYYVLRIVERTPDSEQAVRRAMNDFMEQLKSLPIGPGEQDFGAESPYVHLNLQEERRVQSEWIRRLEETYNVQWLEQPQEYEEL